MGVCGRFCRPSRGETWRCRVYKVTSCMVYPIMDPGREPLVSGCRVQSLSCTGVVSVYFHRYVGHESSRSRAGCRRGRFMTRLDILAAQTGGRTVGEPCARMGRLGGPTQPCHSPARVGPSSGRSGRCCRGTRRRAVLRWGLAPTPALGVAAHATHAPVVPTIRPCRRAAVPPCAVVPPGTPLHPV